MVHAIAVVRDEADIIEHTVRHMLTQVDAVTVLDNGSVDGTREILDALPITVLDDSEPHYQSRKMSQLAAQAQADWVVPFDADEWWYSPRGRIADVLADLPGAVAPAAIYNHYVTGHDPEEPNPIKRMGWREREPLPLHKAACRPALRVTITEGNHSAHYPSQAPAWDLLELRHYPYRSAAQMIRKARNGAAALAATDLPEDVGKHWRDYGRLTDEQLTETFYGHFFTADPTTSSKLIFDPA